MEIELTTKYPHLLFSRNWDYDLELTLALGQCTALIDVIKKIPVLPAYRENLLKLALIKGAQSTTAIEGNTLTEEQIARIMEGYKLAPSLASGARNAQCFGSHGKS